MARPINPVATRNIPGVQEEVQGGVEQGQNNERNGNNVARNTGGAGNSTPGTRRVQRQIAVRNFEQVDGNVAGTEAGTEARENRSPDQTNNTNPNPGTNFNAPAAVEEGRGRINDTENQPNPERTENNPDDRGQQNDGDVAERIRRQRGRQEFQTRAERRVNQPIGSSANPGNVLDQRV